MGVVFLVQFKIITYSLVMDWHGVTVVIVCYCCDIL